MNDEDGQIKMNFCLFKYTIKWNVGLKCQWVGCGKEILQPKYDKKNNLKKSSKSSK